MSEINIYCDGACSGNPGKGGWAAIIVRGNKELIISGNNPYTTNNQMELTAVISALEMLKKENLKTCPSANSSDSVKLIHYYLIKMLYRMPGFSVPVAGAWGLPHIVRKISDDEYNIAEKTALDIIMTECFVGIPYPRLIEDNYTKVYICHDSNGKEFYLQV